MRILAATLIAAIVLAGCQWVEPPPDMLASEYYMGAVVGCVRVHVHAMGPVDDATRRRVELYCANVIAQEALQIRQTVRDSEMSDVPTPEPGSTL